MSTVQDAPPAVADPAAIPAPLPEAKPYCFTAEVFGRMLDAEVFEDRDRIELWDGQVCAKMAKTQAHAIAGNKANRVLTRLLADGWFTGNENPVNINQTRVPLPDFVVLRGEPDDYHDRRPSPANVGLIVEFSCSSVKEDTGSRLIGYAQAGIPVYWVLDLIKNVVLTFERPIPPEGCYESTQTYVIGQSVPLRLDGVLIAEIPAADLLPVRA